MRFAAVLVLCACSGASMVNPEPEIRAALARQPRVIRSGPRAPGGGTLSLDPVRYHEVAASTDAGRATVITLVEADGRLDRGGESIALSYIGREKFHMRPCDRETWCPEEDQLSQLEGVLKTLLERQGAFERRDAAAYGRLVSPRYQERGVRFDALLARIRADFARGPAARVRIAGWQIRVERESALVGEDYELTLGENLPRRLRARYTLERGDDGWRIAGGL